MASSSHGLSETGHPVRDGDSDVVISLSGVEKSFGATRALKGIDLEIQRGTVHALVGENGAGKSTCLGVIAGRVHHDRGELRVFGQRLDRNNARRARAAGVVSVYQELTTLPDLSAQDNVFLGQLISRAGIVNDREMTARYRAICAELGVACHANEPAGRLSVADQQLLEILRAVVSEAKIILLDEPTASLAPHERELLLRLMDVLRSSGITIVLVSHNLDEVLRISDVVSVFRDGLLVKQESRANISKDEIVEAMLGRALIRRSTLRPAAARHESRLRVEDLSVPGAVSNISFDLAPGEIIGIGGLVGSGRSTVLRALAGAAPKATGDLWLDGVHRPWPRSPRKARALGIALIPEDRKTQGLVPVLTAAENIILSDLRSPARLGFLSARRVSAASKRATRGFGIDASRLSHPAAQLSGGNQQKLLLARWAHSPPAVLLADEPTRGIDIGAKTEILEHLRRLADTGMSIVIVSSELEEIMAISSRVLVLVEGRAAGFLDNGAGVDERDVLQMIFAAQEGEG